MNEKAFWNRVHKGKKCWNWLGGKDTKGYGTFFFESENTYKRYKKAHLISYILTKGPIPNGMLIDHLCKNKSCVNPDHLEAVTSRENSLRATNTIASINASKTHCPVGHPLDGDNLIISKNGHNGARRCKTCKNEKERARQKLKPRIRDRRKKPTSTYPNTHSAQKSNSQKTDTSNDSPCVP